MRLMGFFSNIVCGYFYKSIGTFTAGGNETSYAGLGIQKILSI